MGKLMSPRTRLAKPTPPRPEIDAAAQEILKQEATKPTGFCIKATDKLALKTIAFWMAEAHKAGVSHEKIGKAHAHFTAIADWQVANQHKVKVPD